MRAARARSRPRGSAPFDELVAWHDIECGGYEADLPLWRELAAGLPGPVLELGAGTGRVALDLAARGHEVTALDSVPVLTAACAARARVRGLRIQAVCADARSFSLGRRFDLLLAPMQVVQLLEDARGREAMLLRALDHLEPGGVLAPALADPFAGLSAADSLPPLPDTGERDGWELTSTPLAVREEHDARGGRTVAIDRLRRAVSPDGETLESAATVRLSAVTPAELAAEAAAHGFRRLPDRSIPETEGYVGSTVLMLEAPPRP